MVLLYLKPLLVDLNAVETHSLIAANVPIPKAGWCSLSGVLVICSGRGKQIQQIILFPFQFLNALICLQNWLRTGEFPISCAFPSL